MKLYSNDTKKTKSREIIINTYRELFYHTMPKNKSFISLCSPQIGENCETDQLFKSGLITQKQYFGIDYDSTTININKNKLPNCNWFCGHIQYIFKRPFNPGIVNLDTLYMPEKAINLTTEILKILNRRQINEVMIAINIILKNRHQCCRHDEIQKTINSNERFCRYIHENNWQTNNNIYMYNGTGNKSKSILGTIILYKR